MKIFNLLLLILLFLFIFTSCNKQKKNLENTSTDIIEPEKILTETIPSEVKEYNQDLQFTYDYAQQDEIKGIISGKDGHPDEVDIASGHKLNLKDWFMMDMSPDGKYYISYTGEYNNTYARYYIPVKCERKDFNLIMLKEESPLFNPNDMGANNKEIYSAGCEFEPIARSKEPILFNEQSSYWFEVFKNQWIPGSSVYIQPGIFEKLPVKNLEVGISYEKIKDGAWFVVKTDDGSSLRLRDSSILSQEK